MKVTVIGTGNMGAAFVKQLTRAGHQVSMTGRDFSKAQALAQSMGFAIHRSAND
jgi:3-hydroxyisobutyrate dehydrogenase-like beta-hydroxyacid dehydrogenase